MTAMPLKETTTGHTNVVSLLPGEVIDSFLLGRKLTDPDVIKKLHSQFGHSPSEKLTTSCQSLQEGCCGRAILVQTRKYNTVDA